ncbi:hypothetical protein B0I08_103353 [Glaciihabitans tibetensis]|uniref:Uncharacterized protein n=2 Tax=Glaciihabitans tibetensis TaxID=1266600 RepID=A0A2T0VG48_9MICO|nr:hypothetical protein B0I08_103353 [Glaciihabitans tibetensis]
METFRRPPESPAEFAADGVRIFGVLSLVISLVIFGTPAIAAFSLVIVGQMVPRMLGMRPALDIAVGIVLLVAGWSNVLNLYTTVPGWDLLVHFFTNGLVAAMLYLLFVRFTDPEGARTVRTSPTVVILTTAFGLSAGVFWEQFEWLAHNLVDDTIFVAYNDTIGDLTAGGLGSLLAGLAMTFVASPAKSPSRRATSAVS